MWWWWCCADDIGSFLPKWSCNVSRQTEKGGKIIDYCVYCSKWGKNENGEAGWMCDSFGNKKADAFGLERCDMHNIVHDYDYYESWSIWI